MKKNILLLILTFLTTGISAQVFTNKKVKKKTVNDTISDYPYSLPILGKKAFEQGYDLPYSAGLSVNYMWQESSILIKDLNVGFNGGTKFSLDNIVRFNEATASSNVVNFRPDIWVFPFLNIYGILATSRTSTLVDFTIRVPNGLGYTEVLNTSTKAEFSGTTAGFGITPTFGVAGGFVALDLNVTWTDIPELDKPSRIFVFGPRVGKNFKFKDSEKALAIWVGGFRVDMNSATDGQLAVGDLFSGDDLTSKIESGYIRLDEAQNSLDTWWAGLTPKEQAQNAAKKAAAQVAINKANGILGEVEQTVDNVGNSTIEYGLSKRQENLWNLIIGAQFQLNKSLMFRVEGGFLGTRNQVLAGIQYRFGL
ncbi:MAG: hypothetical protein ACPGEG_10345 [Salibacteraceae bacterium]